MSTTLRKKVQGPEPPRRVGGGARRRPDSPRRSLRNRRREKNIGKSASARERGETHGGARRRRTRRPEAPRVPENFFVGGARKSSVAHRKTPNCAKSAPSEARRRSRIGIDRSVRAASEV